MVHAKLHSRALIEPLETRRLLSASAHHAPVLFPPVVGLYNGSAVYFNGQTQSFTVLIATQHGGAFAGTSQDFTNFTTSKVTGNVTRKDVIHFHLKPERAPGVVTGQGTVSADGTTITMSVKVKIGRQSATGTFTLTQDAGTT